jgi:AcrR family transcriptional regulator
VAYRPTARTEARKAETRERIVAAALDQLAEGGYASASVQGVAARAGVATGSVYRHFDSKAALFAEVFRRGSAREVAVFLEATRRDAPAAERIAAAAETFSRRALAEPKRAYALIAEPVDPAVEAERLAFRHDYRDALKGVLEDGIASGEFAPHDTETTAAALVGAIGEALVGPLSPAARGGNEALIAGLVQFCLNAIPKEEAHERHRAANA